MASSGLPVSAALAGSAGSEVGRQAWAGLAALVRRPFRRGTVPEPAGNGLPRASSGELELAALQEDSTDLNRARALATALHVRAALDEELRVRLEEWWQGAQVAGGEVHNSVSGGTQNGPVIQGRNFSNLTVDMTGGTEKPDRAHRDARRRRRSAGLSTATCLVRRVHHILRRIAYAPRHS